MRSDLEEEEEEEEEGGLWEGGFLVWPPGSQISEGIHLFISLSTSHLLHKG